MRTLGAILLVFAGMAPLGAKAQSQECGYPECALRVRFGVLGGQSLIRAESGEKLRGVGFPVSGLDRSFAGSPVAQDLARTYQNRTNIGTTLILASAASFLVWLFDDANIYGEYDNTWLWVALPLGVAGGVTAASGRDYLSQAVWEYNKSLSRSTGSSR